MSRPFDFALPQGIAGYGDVRNRRAVVIDITTIPEMYPFEFSDSGSALYLKPLARVQFDLEWGGVQYPGPWVMVYTPRAFVIEPQRTSGQTINEHVHFYTGVVGTWDVETGP